MAGETRPTVWTIGHGTRTAAEIAAILQAAGARVLVDVRRFPRGKRQPNLSRDRLAKDLPAVGIAYEWWGEDLGGFRKRVQDATRHPAIDSFRAYAEHMDSEEFQAALHRLEERARAGDRPAIMCAETVWWRCHRRLIADALTLDGVDVIHLIDRAPGELHPLHPAVRLDELGRPTYDVGAE